MVVSILVKILCFSPVLNNYNILPKFQFHENLSMDIGMINIGSFLKT